MVESFSERIDGILRLADLSPRELGKGAEDLPARRRDMAIAIDKQTGVEKAQKALHALYNDAGSIVNPITNNPISAQQAAETDTEKLHAAAQAYIENYETYGGYRGYNYYPNVTRKTPGGGQER